MVEDTPIPVLGRSPAALSARVALASLAEQAGAVLLVAESGSRVADLARALHDESRRGGHFVPLSCAAEDPLRIEQRLFGTRRGSTSHEVETVSSECAILQAGDGTLLLEDVDQLPASSQRRLDRVLRDAEVRLPGSRSPVAAAFRLIATTSRDLEGECREGRFREDLLRRLLAGRVEVPPLRARPSDLPEVIERLTRDAGRPVVVTAPALTLLMTLPWPRNIDELAELLDRLTAAGVRRIRPEDVLSRLPVPAAFGRLDLTASLREARRQFERSYVAAVLARHDWSMSDAARTLGIERANLYRKTRQLGIVRVSRAGSPPVRRP